ncbi:MULTISPECIES: LmeA family phospholipid-binding protein [Nostocales]|uniref:DUF2993 domain-containing protein n=4 Tax=Nostocales TaxID=1161 RepID=A0A8S9TBZ5_9CYAN|nr:DUF2993 domain-containing protein [Tolypothrix bouteillei]KAF3889114.1 DUF2993 domain-containing protein [Tolypothrix bouteillei VB521301]
MQHNSSQTQNPKIRIVTKVLTTALKLWLKAQVSQVEQLEVEIKASDRQLLSGCIPFVSIFGSHAVYQGLHLTRIHMVAENIRVNIGSVLKGQPLKLLETVPVVGELIQTEEDLNASLSSTLLLSGLNDALVQLLPEQKRKSKSVIWQKINLDNSKVVLSATLAQDNQPTYLEIGMGVELLSSHELRLQHIQVQSNTASSLEGIERELDFDLGSDVDIQELTIHSGKLVCRGRINVNP